MHCSAVKSNNMNQLQEYNSNEHSTSRYESKQKQAFLNANIQMWHHLFDFVE